MGKDLFGGGSYSICPRSERRLSHDYHTIYTLIIERGGYTEAL